MRYLIISDLHLGHRSSKAASYLSGLARIACQYERIIINGDALDRFDAPEPDEEAVHWLGQLTRMLEGKAGPPRFLTGNHDPLISREHFLYLEEPQLLAFHGDYVLDRSSPWNPAEREMAIRFNKNLALVEEELTFELRAKLFRDTQVDFYKDFPIHATSATPWRYVLEHLLPPTRIFTIMHYHWHFPSRVKALISEYSSPLRHVVFGHSHRDGRWDRGDTTLYNTGSFMPYSRPWAVQVEGSRVTFCELASLLAPGSR